MGLEADSSDSAVRSEFGFPFNGRLRPLIFFFAGRDVQKKDVS